MIDKVKKQIEANIDTKYREFSKKLLPNVDKILGVRIPILRNIAKDISKNSGIKYLENCPNDYMEEIMLEGFVIGNLKENKKTVIKYIDRFVPKINNWSVCDSFASSLKIVKQDKDYFFDYLCNYQYSKDEFSLRFMLVMFLNYYIDEKYLDSIFNIIDIIKKDDYYVKMAIAWYLSYSYIEYRDETLKYLKHCSLDNWTYNKTIQKIIESKKIAKSEKNLLKQLKK